MQTENFSLKKYNTFGLDVFARYYFSCNSEADLQYYIKHNLRRDIPFFIIGGGSNLLFTQDYVGTIIHPLIKGIEIFSEDDDNVYVKVGAGEVWDDFVAWAVSRNLHGVENLSLIPGNVGAAPVQNIGAYGAEAKDVIYAVNTIEIETGERRGFLNSDCKFGYRNSVFKQEQAGKHIVFEVVFKLSRNAEYNIEYGSIKDELAKEDVINLQSIRKVIVDIRKSKLPDPEEIGNAGSFFKNPIVSKAHFAKVQIKYPNIVFYNVGDEIKIAAGWLIDTLGFKGDTLGGAKVHDNQALVLTNTGTATGAEIVALSKKIIDAVYKETGIELEPEVIFL